MDKKYYIIMAIGLVVIMQSAVFALIPPPPANQMLGTYDTNFAELVEGNCRSANCHSSGVPDTHHLLVPTGEYQCMNCHPIITNPDGSESATIIRDCKQCHGTTFNSMTIRIPHHETQDALDRHCSYCHGNYVDDYDDGHYIPTYNISLVTPDVKYKEINATTGKKWGGCESCHERNETVSPVIYFNNKTHHRLGALSGFNPPDNSKCMFCHDLHGSQYGQNSIRNCERCHAVKSLHNIQYDYVNTSNQLGNGHIGPNWDCNGCHAWYVAGGAAPGTDVIIPSIATLSTGKLYEGETTDITISGKDLVTTMGSVTHTSVVVITDGTNPVTVTPSSITAGSIVVTVPALSKGLYGIYALKNGDVKSNKLPLVVTARVDAVDAQMSGSTITVTGTGFGSQPDPLFTDLGVFINTTTGKGKNKVTTAVKADIVSWSDTQIVCTADVSTGDPLTVKALGGSDTVTIGGGSTPTPTPTTTPTPTPTKTPKPPK